MSGTGVAADTADDTGAASSGSTYTEALPRDRSRGRRADGAHVHLDDYNWLEDPVAGPG